MDRRWIRDELASRGLHIKDLASAWGVPEASLGPILNGQDSGDITLSRAWALATLLGTTTDDLVWRLGLAAAQPQGDRALRAGAPGAISIAKVGNRTRLTVHADLPHEVAGEIIRIITLEASKAHARNGAL